MSESLFLEPCPFCAARNVIFNFNRDQYGEQKCYVRCYACGACGSRVRDAQQAVDAWNMVSRAAHQAQEVRR